MGEAVAVPLVYMPGMILNTWYVTLCFFFRVEHTLLLYVRLTPLGSWEPDQYFTSVAADPLLLWHIPGTVKTLTTGVVGRTRVRIPPSYAF